MIGAKRKNKAKFNSRASTLDDWVDSVLELIGNIQEGSQREINFIFNMLSGGGEGEQW